LEEFFAFLKRNTKFKDIPIESKMNSSSKRKENNQSQRGEFQLVESEGSENDSTIQ